ncbi:galactoside 2-alpha-L-fucosyltransferase isoform X2 [Jatropha curcas]|uniref:galactoside 2-alpha-L-fucosyltransferase isoform X2 n=1 Tax=Jatropha curcas TaxID=180498 RepID=UPI0005FAE7A3|nr:galactoside 2-alpha-L-fucosyltransferase isoform X2 [Jatropha curcas]
MDLNSFTRRRLSLSKYTDQGFSQLSRLRVRRFGSSTMTLTKILASGLVALPLLFALATVLRHPPSDRFFGFAEARVLQNGAQPNVTAFESIGLGLDKPNDKLLAGLLAAGFDEAACTSRYQSSFYRKASLYKPSSYLISRLRSYEDLHKRCGPNTESYNKAIEQLKSDRRIVSANDCKYIVWISFSGLGNRILSLASTFLYALLTNRVLLVDRGKDMDDLFCEPFPENSWLLPMDFPVVEQFGSFDQQSSHCYGNMLKNNVINATEESIRPYVYLHLVHDYDDHDKLFFCDEDQSLLAKVPWLIMKSDNYFVPSLFLITSFEKELSNLFPQKGTIFHHLGRYLFHPSNPVWGLITRYYKIYLAKADESIGIQIRVFDSRPGPFKHVMDQILACTLHEKLLPEVDMQDSVLNLSDNPKLKAVLVTSLNSGYSENLRNMYWEYPTRTGEVVGVYQPSHEEYQQTEKYIHNRKAWAEMYLLSLTDTLVTSSWSTFGYVAQGLGGLRPWILYKPENETAPDPPCRRAISMEPCFHAPPYYDCKAKRGTDTGALVPHVRHCEDMNWGLKVVDGHDEL